MRHHFHAAFAFAMLCWVHTTRASELCVLPDGTPILAGDQNDVPYLARWADGAWQPITVPAELVPAKGEFEEVTADAQGNLYVSYADETNAKKKSYGLLARVGGSWTRLGTFDKSWETGSHLAAASPTEVYLDARTIKERQRLLLRWDGQAYTTALLPEGTEEVNGLLVHEGRLVLLAYGRGPSGNYGDGSSTFRYTGAGWERMGGPADENVDLLLPATNGRLWRLGRTAERWNGSAWERGFHFNGSSISGYRITDACAGNKGDLYLVLEDADYKDLLAYWPGEGGMRWMKGSADAARFKYGLYDPFLDRDGSLVISESGSWRRFTYAADFDYAPDGYPNKDEKAREVYELFTNGIGRAGSASKRFSELQARFVETRSEADFQALEKAYEEALGAHTTAIDGLEALGIEAKRNRLYDAFLPAMEAGKDQVYYQWKMALEIRADGDPLAFSDKLMDANHRQVEAIAALEQAIEGYVERNGIVK